jgi:hypothetical protein
MTGVKWSNGNHVTYQKSNGNWIIRNKSGKAIGIYKKGSSTGNYLTKHHVSKTYKSKSSSKKKTSSGSASSTNSNSSNSSSSTDTDTSSTDGTTTDNTTTTTTTAKVIEIPITNYEDAVKRAKLMMNKEMRKDGHSIECKVFGSNEWCSGNWVKVKIPSFDEDGYMYLTKVSHSTSADDVWTTSLTLQDYPPSLGSGTSNDPNSQTSTDTSSTDTSSTDSTSTDTASSSSTGSTSSSSSSGSSSSSSGSSKKKTTRKSGSKKTTKKRTTYRTAYKGSNVRSNKSTSKTKNPTGKAWYVNLGNWVKKSIGWK